MRTQEWTFNMVTVITTNILWHMTIRTGDRSDHTLVLTRKNKALQVMPWPFRRKPSILLVFLATVDLGQYLRESIFCGCNWGCILACMEHFTALPEELMPFFCYKFLSSDFSLRMPPVGICCPQPIRPICA